MGKLVKGTREKNMRNTPKQVNAWGPGMSNVWQRNPQVADQFVEPGNQGLQVDADGVVRKPPDSFKIRMRNMKNQTHASLE